MQINACGNEGEDVVCWNYKHDYVRQGAACAGIIDGSCEHSWWNLPGCQQAPRYDAWECPHSWPILPSIVTFSAGLDCPGRWKLCVWLVCQPRPAVGEVGNGVE